MLFANSVIPSTAAAPLYDRVTETWRLLLGEDLHYGFFLTPGAPLAEATARLTAEMASRAALARHMSVLDIGCGIGSPARFLANQLGCRVTGISTSEIGVRIATALTRLARLDDVEFHVRDGMANGFPPRSYDCAWVMEASHLMADKPKLISECARVLRPGGRLALCDIILRAPVPFPELLKRLPVFQCLERVFGKAKMEPLETYRRIAEENGLSVVHVADISAETYPTFECWRKRARSHRERIAELVGERYWQDFVDACGYLMALWNDGTLGYGILVAVAPGEQQTA